MNIGSINSLHSIVFTVGRIGPDGVQLLGTCFLINKPGLFATTAHVPSNNDSNLVIAFSANTNLANYQDTSDTRVQYVPVKIIAVDTIRDICILKTDADVVPHLVIGGADQVTVSQNLAIVGFPHCTDGRRVLTYQNTVVGAKVLIENSGIKSKHLIINIQSRPGQSGSPILRDSDGLLVGMLLGSYAPSGGGSISLGGVDPQTLHQTTHAISSEYILNMV